MRRVMKTILLTAVLLAGLLQSAMAYSLGGPIGNGPDASWQIPALGYGLPGDLNAPKNLGEGYRRNVPVMYYTFDVTFANPSQPDVGYFGTYGIDAVDKAFYILNTMFTNNPQGITEGLGGYSLALSEFPFDTRHLNYEGQSLGVMDIKSQVLSLMVEQLGLADPVRYAWDVDRRYLPPGGACPLDEEYSVLQRNFSFVPSSLTSAQYSPYVNNVLYTYFIEEFCTPSPPILAWTVPETVDHEAADSSAVASQATSAHGLSVYWGQYYSGLTQDDVAGLRYLMQTNNVNYERIPVDSILYTISTNRTEIVTAPPLPNSTNFLSGTNGGYYVYVANTNGAYGYGDYAGLLAYSATNADVMIEAAYPGVIVNTITNWPVIASNATIVTYYTNPPPGYPYGAPPLLVVVTNYSLYFETIYSNQFLNVFPLHWTTKGSAYLFTQTVGSPPGTPYGYTLTNTTVTKVQQNSGDFLVLTPFYTNFCPAFYTPYGLTITNVIATTNLLSVSTTNTTTTNLASTVYLVNYFTNYSYAANPVTCTATPGATDYYQGIEKIQFVKVDPANYDSLNRVFIVPITNNYTMIRRNPTNGVLQVQYLQRIVFQPDILIMAEEMSVGGAQTILNNPLGARNLSFDTQFEATGRAGPGIITNKAVLDFNISGPMYFNTPLDTMNGSAYFNYPPELGTATNEFYLGYYVWGSMDSTNVIVFPNGTSIQNLEYQSLVKLSWSSSTTNSTSYPSPLVPDGTAGAPYAPVTFTAAGGPLGSTQQWMAGNLPDGLSVSPSGVLSGIPTTPGTYDFSLTVTDSSNSSISVEWTYTITIND